MQQRANRRARALCEMLLREWARGGGWRGVWYEFRPWLAANAA
jgi:hypothetical protein